jgi:serine/threonine-protein kinase RsbW
MAEPPNVRLQLSNRPENVLLVRELLSGVAESIELDGGDLNDVRTAVTEACNNVVLHAYGGREGLLEVEVHSRPDALEVVVRDHGTGIHPRIRTGEDTALGIGLSVIQALVQRVEFREAQGRGTEVRMEFATEGAQPLHTAAGDGPELPALEGSQLGTTTGVAIAPADLARTVLPRVLSVLAARANFSTDRISDTQLLADALVAHAPSAIGGDGVSMAVAVEPCELELRIGPLAEERAQQLLVESSVDGVGPVIEKLTDHHAVTSVGTTEMLTLRLLDRR